MKDKQFSLTDTKNQIELLNRMLNQRIGALLEAEIKYRALNSFVMAGKKGNDLMSAHHQAKQNIDFLREEIRHIKALMLDIGNNNYQV